MLQCCPKKLPLTCEISPPPASKTNIIHSSVRRFAAPSSINAAHASVYASVIIVTTPRHATTTPSMPMRYAVTVKKRQRSKKKATCPADHTGRTIFEQ